MTAPVVGLVAPGEMGAAVGAAAAAGGTQVVWASDGRGLASAARAAEAGLVDVGDLRALVGEASVVMSICPPHAATDIARAVADLGFDGIYVDANAVAPATSVTIADIVEPLAQYVDGGITGAPPQKPGSATRLFLAGLEAGRVASLFHDSPLTPVVLPGGVPAASSMKIAYAAWTKGSSALLLAVRAFAADAGIDDELLEHWAVANPELPEQLDRVAATASPKAWRWVGEMDEIAVSFAAAGLPAGFHQAAGQVYGSLSGRKNSESTRVAEAVADLLAGGERD